MLKILTDVELVCTDESSCAGSIFCHKIVLAAFSPYFSAMFSSNFIENQTNKVFMPNTELASLEQIINYAYSGSINMNISNIQCIFSLASLLQVTELLNACTDYMHSNLDASNAIGVYHFVSCCPVTS